MTNSVNALPGEFETSGAVLGGIMRNDLMRRPENYYVQLPARYKGGDRRRGRPAMRAALDPKGFTWVVVGDAAKLGAAARKARHAGGGGRGAVGDPAPQRGKAS